MSGIEGILLGTEVIALRGGEQVVFAVKETIV